MNSIEKMVYDTVKGNPKLKFFLRNIYQSLYDLLPDKENYFKNSPICKEGYFFGFHDTCPFSTNELYILANKLEIPLRMPQKSDPLTVGFWNDDFSVYHEIGKSYAWNYHKGCRLQWLNQDNDTVIYNDAQEELEVSRIVSISNGLLETIQYPIDSVDMSGNYATSFSYERLEKYMPGYGYRYSDEAYLDNMSPNKTGLFLVDLRKNKRRLLLSLKQLAEIEFEDTMKNSFHYVTHSEFSPDGSRISFLHRWTDDPSRRYTRLITCDLDGNDVHVSNTSGMVSHYVWDRENRIIAYCQVNGVDGHYIFDNYKIENPKRVAHSLNSDGHQSFVPNSNSFITDSYPDKRRYAKLYLVNIDNDSAELIADIKSPKKYQSPDMYHHWACDLHPRVSPSGRYVCFDSVYSGNRSMCIMKL